MLLLARSSSRTFLLHFVGIVGYMSVIILADPIEEDVPFFTDPYYEEERWVLDMVNIVPVWQKGYFGSGIRVRINDNGVDRDHAEFQGRFDVDGSCAESNIPKSDQNHATAVASIVGAGGNNDKCSVGIAPASTISSCYALGHSEAFLGEKIQMMDISQNSFERPACAPDDISRRQLEPVTCPFDVHLDNGDSNHPCQVCDLEMLNEGYNDDVRTSPDCEDSIVRHCGQHYKQDTACLEFLDVLIGGSCHYRSLSVTARDAINRGITQGRNGKGIIYVFASGNAFKKGDDTNIKVYTNSRFTIAVGAVGSDGKHSSYSTPGANVLVTAPGGGFSPKSHHVTALGNGQCGYPGVGTSFACPVVSGVIALILEANPDLTWRDIQGILATTSNPVVDDTLDDFGAINGAGLWHSNWYGFGIVNAQKAVTAAESWTLFEQELMWIGESGQIDLLIPDDSNTSIVSSITLSADETTTTNFAVESVLVFLDLHHFSRGDVEIVLTSPQGTLSVLHPGRLPENVQLRETERWKLLTLRNWGESPFGNWQLGVTDKKRGHVEECVDAPFSMVYTGVTVSCRYLEEYSICANQGLVEDFFATGDFDPLLVAQDPKNGMTLESACCVCGGGVDRSSYTDTLRQWKVVVYGHELPPIYLEERTPETPSPSPSILKQSKQPSIKPSSNPTTLSPSKTPSEIPSAAPTTYLSTQPSHSSSNAPSLVTSQEPSQIPSAAATSTPTTQKSSHPSTKQSMEPSRFPSLLPSTVASDFPSPLFQEPSHIPSATATSTPTTQKSSHPSTKQSMEPSRFPLLLPSTVASDFPSPSLQEPSHIPSAAATSTPTTQKSSHPSTKQSMEPSRFPLLLPSTVASDFPSPSLHESIQIPSATATSTPTTQKSIHPSTKQSMEPSRFPSFLPNTVASDFSSNLRSLAPSQSKSEEPSMQTNGQMTSNSHLESPSAMSSIPTLAPHILMPSVGPAMQPITNPPPNGSSNNNVAPTISPPSFGRFSPSSRPTTKPESDIQGAYTVSACICDSSNFCDRAILAQADTPLRLCVMSDSANLEIANLSYLRLTQHKKDSYYYQVTTSELVMDGQLMTVRMEYIHLASTRSPQTFCPANLNMFFSQDTLSTIDLIETGTGKIIVVKTTPDFDFFMALKPQPLTFSGTANLQFLAEIDVKRRLYTGSAAFEVTVESTPYVSKYVAADTSNAGNNVSPGIVMAIAALIWVVLHF